MEMSILLWVWAGLDGSRDVRLAAAKRSTLHSVYIGGLCSGKEAISHWQLLSHGTPVEPRATKRAKKAASVSSTQDMAETDPINSPTATDSEASSDSLSQSSVKAQTCESELEDLVEYYTALRSWSRVMQEEPPPSYPS